MTVDVMELAGRITLPELAALTRAVVARPPAAGVEAKLVDLGALVGIEAITSAALASRLTEVTLTAPVPVARDERDSVGRIVADELARMRTASRSA